MKTIAVIPSRNEDGTSRAEGADNKRGVAVATTTESSAHAGRLGSAAMLRGNHGASLRIALVHEWLTNWAGSDMTFRELADVFPEADLYASVFHESMRPHFADRPVQTTFIQRLPLGTTKPQIYLPLMPLAFKQFDLSQYDVVITSSHACAKGVTLGLRTKHISYCYTPMRYIWEPQVDRRLANPILAPLRSWLRQWDFRKASRVNQFIGISEAVADRIRRFYKQDAVVIHPPVHTENFHLSKETEPYFVFLSRLIPYKRADIVIEACNRLGIRLKVAGTGPMLEELKSQAGPTIEFLGRISDADKADLYARSQGLVFAAEEDFGIVMVEAMAAGRPVIAYGVGGARDIVLPGVTGEFFTEPTVDALVRVLQNFDPSKYDPAAAVAQAKKFDAAVFRQKMRALVDEVVAVAEGA